MRRRRSVLGVQAAGIDCRLLPHRIETDAMVMKCSSRILHAAQAGNDLDDGHIADDDIAFLSTPLDGSGGGAGAERVLQKDIEQDAGVDRRDHFLRPICLVRFPDPL